MEASREIEQARGQYPVGVLDVDHTIVHTTYQGDDVYNLELFAALKANGIKDVYLFTDMKFSPEDVADRMKLIGVLKKAGFTVLGSVTPADFAFDLPPDELKGFFKEVDTAIQQRRLNLGRNNADDHRVLTSILEKYPALKNRFLSNLYPNVGQAFAAAEATLKRGGNVDATREHSFHAKMFTDVVAMLRGHQSNKGVMLEQLVANKPPKVSSCYVFDDKNENIIAAREAKNMGTPIHAILGTFSDKKNDFASNFAKHALQEAEKLLTKFPLSAKDRAAFAALKEKYSGNDTEMDSKDMEKIFSIHEKLRKGGQVNPLSALFGKRDQSAKSTATESSARRQNDVAPPAAKASSPQSPQQSVAAAHESVQVEGKESHSEAASVIERINQMRAKLTEPQSHGSNTPTQLKSAMRQRAEDLSAKEQVETHEEDDQQSYEI